MTEKQLLTLWAKTVKGDSKAYHPLLFHMLDVAHVAFALWDYILTRQIKQRIVCALGLTVEQARLAVAVLTGLHDLGKACPAFQRQVKELFERLRHLGLPDTDFVDQRPLHGFVTTKELMRRFELPEMGWQAEVEAAYCLAAIVGGHHGVFPNSHHLKHIHYEAGNGKDQPWEQARDQLVSVFIRLVAGDSFARSPLWTGEFKDPGVVPLLAGFVSVADWIGSAQEHFPAAARIDEEPPAPEEYIRYLSDKARGALKAFGWLPQPAAARPQSIAEIFRYIEGFKPNAMQRAVARIAEVQTGSYLLIVEEAMGRGKSEAGLYTFDRAFSEGRTCGLYVALPTMATGNAMFQRVREYLKNRGHGGRLELQLIHGNALLNKEFHDLVFNPIYVEGRDYQHAAAADAAGAEGQVSAGAWFTARKRALLAPFGAGTIDQSLLGVLQTRHWFVRLFGLAGKVVVFDEVHSYDAYMLTELGLLLRWLRELDCTVILLSATLTRAIRYELIRAWGADPPEEEKKYPRVTVATTGRACAEHVGEASDLDRTVELEWAAPDPEFLPALVRRNLPKGGCGVIICNTVDRAQVVFRRLRDEFKPAGWRVILYHARMPMAWREKREAKVRSLLGKRGDRSKPTLIIGTQVLEQSLDYDADWMASDIAPIDLLIQRMGRLWRHPQDNPPENRPVDRPCLTILSDAPKLDSTEPFANAGVYARYILQRTWLAIHHLPAIRLPQDIEPLIEAAYADDEPSGLDPIWQDALAAGKAALLHDEEVARSKAEGCLAPQPERPRRVLGEPNRKLDDDENPQLHETIRALTRDAEPTITVVCQGTDKQGGSLAPMVDGPLSSAQARAILRFSLSIQKKAIFFALLNEQPPANWRENPHLRYSRVLNFERGICTSQPGGFTLSLDREEGLVIEKR